MHEPTDLIDRYVAVWNEPDADARRRRIRSVWAPNGTTCHRLTDARGYAAIEARVAGSWDRWLRDGRYIFRAVRAVSHHDAIKFEFAMVAIGDGKIEAHGLCYLLLADDGRLIHDYQFNPSVNEAVTLAERYLAPWNEPDAEGRRARIAELWAEDGALFTATAATRGLAGLTATASEMHDTLVADERAASADRSHRHHDVAHVAWRIAPRGGGAATGAGSALLVFDAAGRISTAYHFNERMEGP